MVFVLSFLVSRGNVISLSLSIYLSIYLSLSFFLSFFLSRVAVVELR